MAALSSANAGRLADRFGPRFVALPGGLVFAAGCLWLALALGAERRYVTDFLPGTLLTGTGVGLSFSGWSAAAVAKLPPARFATGSAISACCRQIGAVLGIAVLFAVLGDALGLADFHRAYTVMTVTGATSALIALALGRVRATVPAWASKSAPSTTPSPEPAPSAARG
jgi:NTE family protein